LQRKRKGHGRLGRVETDLLARTLPSETKEHAKTHTGETHCAPLLKAQNIFQSASNGGGW